MAGQQGDIASVNEPVREPWTVGTTLPLWSWVMEMDFSGSPRIAGVPIMGRVLKRVLFLWCVRFFRRMGGVGPKQRNSNLPGGGEKCQ